MTTHEVNGVTHEVYANEEQAKEAQKDRREALELAIEDVPQANIDLMCIVIAGDAEKRSASFWLAEAFVYVHKYQKRLREYAQERKRVVERKENEALFNKYIAMTPPKNPAEYLTLLQRFGLIDANPFVQAAPAPAVAASEAAKTA